MDKEKLAPMQSLRLTEHWTVFEKLLNDRYLAHMASLKTAHVNDIPGFQGRIAELEEIFNWFGYRIEEEKLRLEGVRDRATNTKEEEY